MKYDRAALKQEVKNDLRNTRPKAIVVTLVYLLVTYGVGLLLELVQLPLTNVLNGAMADLQWMMEQISSGPFNERELMRALENMEIFDALESVLTLGPLFALFSAAVNWTLTFGYEGYCLSMVRRRNPGFSRLLCAFPKWGWVLLTGFLIALFTTLWTILLCVLGVIASVLLMLFVSDSSMGITLVIVVWLAVVAAMVSITLRYSVANYILLDEKVDALEAISRSKAMMRGRKFHMFVLQMSFIGWVLLTALIGGIVGGIGSVISLGAGSAGGVAVTSLVAQLLTLPLMVWLQPYMVGSTAKFYNWMKYTDMAQGVWEGTYPKRRRRPQATQPAEPEQLAAPENPADQTREIPRIPAYEDPTPAEPASVPEQPFAPVRPEEPEQPASPAEDVPDRPSYE